MTKKFEDFLITDKLPQNKVYRFAEYRKGSNEYGPLFQDLMMILRLKKEQDKNTDSIVLTRKDLKNIDFDKLKELLSDKIKMRKLGMSFDAEILDNEYIKFTNLGNKESRPWENNTVNENLFNALKERWNKIFNPGETFSTKMTIGRNVKVVITNDKGEKETIIAKVDTGADSSSIDVGIAKKLNLKIIDKRYLSSALGRVERDYGECYIQVEGREIKTAVGIADRTNGPGKSKFKMLIGRLDLDNLWMVVDVKKSII
jgi:hypothetical protein